MPIRRRVLAAAGAIALLAASAPVRAEPAAYAIYPAPTLFLPVATPAAAAGALPRPEGGRMFVERIKAAFPNTVDDITEGSARRTFVASIQISRISTYDVPKPSGSVDTYIAISGSLYFTNVKTGEVMFTFTKTRYWQRSFGRPPTDRELSDGYQADYQDLLTDLVAQAKASFHPFVVSATARISTGGLFFLDKGSENGLAEGERLSDAAGDELKVHFAGPTYAAATGNLGQPRVGVQYDLVTNRNLEALKKPSALVAISEATDASLPADVLRQMFADGLGASTPFDIVPINPSFSELMQLVAAKTSLKGGGTYQRALPKYFIRLKVMPARTYEVPTNLSYKRQRVASAVAYAEVVDHSGRVLFADRGAGRVANDVTDGASFDLAALGEIATKNALVDLAQKMTASLKFGSVDVPVERVSGQGVTVADAPGALRPRLTYPVMRRWGQIGGLKGDVVAAIWSAHADQVGDPRETVSADLQAYDGAPSVRVGDFVRVSTVNGDAPRNLRHFMPCGGAGESLGAIRLDGVDEAALSAFSQSSGQETDLPQFGRQVADGVNGTGAFGKSLEAEAAEPALCFEPVQRVDPMAEACDGQGVCHKDVRLRLTLHIRRGATVVDREGLETVVHSSGYWRTADQADRDALVAADLDVAADKLLHQLVQSAAFKTSIAGL